MAKNNYKYEKFIVDDPPEEMYGWKYGVDNSKTQYDLHKGQGAAALKSPAAIYMVLLVAFMLFWFAYSFVNAVLAGGSAAVLLMYIPSLLVLAVCATIVFLSIFGAWGRFIRWALKKNMVSNRDGARDRYEAEVEAADANAGKQNALNIYADYIEVVNYGGRKVLDRSLLREVIIKKYGVLCSVEFVSLRGESVVCYADVPSADIHKIKAVFGEICKVKKHSDSSRNYDKDAKAPDFYRQKEKFEFDGGKIGGLVMGFICAAVGGVVIALHYCLEPKIPMPLGLFFIVGGVLVMFTLFSNFAIVKEFFIPFLFGAILTGFPFMFLFSVAQSEGEKIVLPTFHEFLCLFSPFSCGIFFLAGMGVMFIILSFINLIKYLRNR